MPPVLNHSSAGPPGGSRTIEEESQLTKKRVPSAAKAGPSGES